jgi:hypothetical protein
MAADAVATPWRRPTLPKEHGAYLSIVGATAAAALSSPRPAAAVGVGLAVAAAFFARAPLDRAAAGAGLRPGDRVWLAFLAAAAAAGLALAGTARPLFVLAVAALVVSIVGVSAAVWRARRQRDSRFELVAMAGLGATAGLGAFAGGATASVAWAWAVVLAAHATLSVPMVRTELRRGERHDARRAAAVSALALVFATVVLVALGRPIVMLALAPRAAQVVYRIVRTPSPRRPAVVGLWETVLLAATVAIGAALL